MAMAVGNTSLAGSRARVHPARRRRGPDHGRDRLGRRRPFGGDLRLRFDSDDACDLNVKYTTSAGARRAAATPWVELTHAEMRHYAHVVGKVL